MASPASLSRDGYAGIQIHYCATQHCGEPFFGNRRTRDQVVVRAVILLHWLEYGKHGRFAQGAILAILDHSDNFAPGAISTVLETSSDWVFTWKELVNESFVHNRHVATFLAVVLIEYPARDQTRACGSEIIDSDAVSRRERNIGGPRNRLAFDQDAAVVPLQREWKTVN